MKVEINKDYGKAITKSRLAGSVKTTAGAARLMGMTGQQLHQLETEKGRNIRIKTVARLLGAFPALKLSDFFTVTK